jgi:sulfatase maturation enzyme AslB (radical SAM superfamily)
VVSLFDFEYDNIHTELPCDYSSFLYGNYFLVRENFDENQIIDDYKKVSVRYIGPTYLDTPSHFTILTTSKCNARCTYCYEQLLPNKRHMSEETARDIVKYIVENANMNEPLSIEWFGGEPLYNVKVIDIISSTLCSAGLNFTSNVVSNGYLFNNDIIIAKAKNIWKVQDV